MTEVEGIPDNTTDRPLVTFAVFAYNQEDYIREAVLGAFAQTYEPLEIILSDDCSTDRTFEIMQEMAAAYDGPHEVRVRRNLPNFGTALHVGAVAAEMRGSLLVVAAGDDISRGERTETLVSAWRNAGFPIGTLHSEVTLVDHRGKESGTRKLRHRVDECIDIGWFLKNGRLPFLPPTCAYTRELFTQFPPILGGSFIEDSVLACRSMLIGQSMPVDMPLVLKRQLHVSAGQGYVVDEPERWNAFIRSKIVARLTRLQDVMAISDSVPENIRRYQRLTAYEITSLSKFLIVRRRRIGLVRKTFELARVFFWYPSAASLPQRFLFATNCVGWGGSATLKRLISFSRIKKRS